MGMVIGRPGLCGSKPIVQARSGLGVSSRRLKEAANVKRMLDKLGLLRWTCGTGSGPSSPIMFLHPHVKRRCSSMFVARRLFTERGTIGWTHLRDARRENEAENVHTKEIGTSTP